MTQHADVAERLYLDLLKRTLTRIAFPTELVVSAPDRDSFEEYLWQLLTERLGDDFVMARGVEFDVERREIGGDWPADAETMVGLRRLENIEDLVLRCLTDEVPGDLVETGVWRGGAAILMRALLKVRGVTDRTVWVADSFKGLPPPELSRHPQDRKDVHWKRSELAIDRATVEANFARYELLDDQVEFLEGWFAETLPTAPIERIAVLRLDGDMYGSTMDALEALYDRVSPGGYVIVDDYGAVSACRRAVNDFRATRSIDAPIVEVDWTGVWWQVP